MGWFADIRKYADDRQKVIQLRHQLNDLAERMNRETAGMKTASLQFQTAVSMFGSSADDIISDISEIDTKWAVKRAEYWRVPIPRRPFGGYGQDTEFWEWSGSHGRYYLTDFGLREIRKMVHDEREMLSRPILSWVALAISIVSLAVAALKS